MIGFVLSNEWKKWIYAPLFWIVIIIFILHNSLLFFGGLEERASDLELGFQSVGLITGLFVSHGEGLLVFISRELFYYVPLLTMGLISNEKKQGCWILLTSSPLRAFELVAGKYLATLLWGGLLFVIPVSFALLTNGYALQFDQGHVFAGLLGLGLLFAFYAAVGLFISGLTRYPIIAALLAYGVLVAIKWIGTAGQHGRLTRDLFFYLDISVHLENFMAGLVTSKDLVYFIALTALFLLMAARSLCAQMGEPVRGVGRIRYWIYLLLIMTGTMLSANPHFILYSDWTNFKERTISPQTQSILSGIPGPLRIHAYTNILDVSADHGLPEEQNKNREFFAGYTRFRPGIQFDYTYYFDSSQAMLPFGDSVFPSLEGRARFMQQNFGLGHEQILPPDSIRRRLDTRSEEGRFCWVLESGTNKTVLRTFNSILPFPLESDIANALKKLTGARSQICFSQGYGERSIEDRGDQGYYGAVKDPSSRSSLINLGFDVCTCDLRHQPVPDGTNLLVIADPRQLMDTASVDEVLDYLKKGGNLLVCLEPSGPVWFENDSRSLLEPLGVMPLKKTLIQKNDSLSFGQIRLAAAKELDASIALLEGACPVRVTSANSFRQFSLLQTRSDEMYSIPADAAKAGMIAVKQTKENLPDTVAVGMAGWINGREQRIMVIGDADFMSNRMINEGSEGGPNAGFIQSVFKWLSNDDYPVKIDRPVHEEDQIRLSFQRVRIIGMVCKFFFPLLLCLIAYAIMIRRKNR